MNPDHKLSLPEDIMKKTENKYKINQQTQLSNKGRSTMPCHNP